MPKPTEVGRMKPSYILFYGFLVMLGGGFILCVSVNDSSWIGLSFVLFILALAEKEKGN